MTVHEHFILMSPLHGYQETSFQLYNPSLFY